MPRPFRRLTLPEFEALLARFHFTRKINAVHMHHTWRPDHSDWVGEATIDAMWRYHTQTNGWSDIAQHVTIDPHGGIWTGRSWNQAPASASGNNGNARVGPFMFEMVGNFDRGRDPFGGAQKEAALAVAALVQKRFGLPAETLRFHNQMSTKTCPGNSLDYAATVRELKAAHKQLQDASATRGAGARGPFTADALRQSETVEEAARSLLGTPDERGAGLADRADAEPAHEEMSDDDVARVAGVDDAEGGGGERGLFGRALTPAELEALKFHVVNLNQGVLSTNGEFTSSRAEVEAVFNEGLRGWIATRKPGEPVHVVFWAHGGLVSEPCALRQAHEQVRWWKANGVYPVYFVWETGGLETLGAILRDHGARGATGRGLGDAVTDPLVEKLVRRARAHVLWTNIKESARTAHREGGDGAFVAERLRAFLDDLSDADRGRVRLHAVGHSAGAIYHSFFIPTVLGPQGTGPRFATAHFLAPAIRVDEFNQRLEPRVGKDPGGASRGIDHLSIFTMGKNFEKADSVLFYRKSLLYLIRAALEPEPDRPIPILGLEESLRDDPAARRLFFPLNAKAVDADVVFGVTDPHAPRTKRTTARRHGDFDGDPATLESVLRRILQTPENQEVPQPPKPTTPEGDCGILQLPGSLFARDFDAGFGGDGGGFSGGFGGDAYAAAGLTDGGGRGPLAAGPFAAAPGGGGATTTGRKKAVCIGIDQYPRAPLSGCVADAEMWAATLTGLGFGVRALRNQEATRAGILGALGDLVKGSRAGDVLVFQYAGHGTTVPDTSGDEGDGDSPRQDEALCPIDYASGRLLVDDDVAVALRPLARGANLTFFIDCCHSGTISRFAVGDPVEGQGRRARFIPPSPELVEAHLRFRREAGAPTASRSRGPEGMSEVVFSACRSTELAYEKDGHGDFTVRATRILATGAGRVTHEQFQAQVTQAFGPAPAQHPVLDCAPSARRRALLAPLGREGDDAPALDGADAAVALGDGSLPSTGAASDAGEAAKLLRAVADLLDRG